MTTRWRELKVFRRCREHYEQFFFPFFPVGKADWKFQSCIMSSRTQTDSKRRISHKPTDETCFSCLSSLIKGLERRGEARSTSKFSVRSLGSHQTRQLKKERQHKNSLLLFHQLFFSLFFFFFFLFPHFPRTVWFSKRAARSWEKMILGNSVSVNTRKNKRSGPIWAHFSVCLNNAVWYAWSGPRNPAGGRLSSLEIQLTLLLLAFFFFSSSSFSPV